jgi:ribosomal protein L11 methyltransferase
VREVVLRLPAEAVEDVLDRLLPMVPGGVRPRPRGRQVELTMRGDDLPSRREIQLTVGRWPHRLTEREASDDWHERRLADYEPNVIGGRLVVRPEWAPAPSEPGILDIALSESSAFGVGGHPTTRTCLEWLLEVEPRGAFADLGCGTGVLAIAAAKLGWNPVAAVDVAPAAVEATAANARANGVEVSARVLDLATEPAPAADGFAANFPDTLHAQVAATLPDPAPSLALLSGFVAGEAAGVLEAYAGRGLSVRKRVMERGWTVVILERDLPTPEQ